MLWFRRAGQACLLLGDVEASLATPVSASVQLLAQSIFVATVGAVVADGLVRPLSDAATLLHLHRAARSPPTFARLLKLLNFCLPGIFIWTGGHFKWTTLDVGILATHHRVVSVVSLDPGLCVVDPCVVLIRESRRVSF